MRTASLLLVCLTAVGTACGPPQPQAKPEAQPQSQPQPQSDAPVPVDLLPGADADELQLVVAPVKHAQAAGVLLSRCQNVVNLCTFGRLGTVDGREIYFLTLRQPDSLPERQTRTVILDGIAASTTPLRALLEVSFQEGILGGGTAEFHETDAGPVIAIRIDVPGTGSFNNDVVLQWTNRRWSQIDPNKWVSELTLPPCYEIWKGRRADLKAMRGQSSVWVAGDANCCPSGGDVTAALEIRDRAIRVRHQQPQLVPLEKFQKEPDRARELKACMSGKPRE